MVICRTDPVKSPHHGFALCLVCSVYLFIQKNCSGIKIPVTVEILKKSDCFHFVSCAFCFPAGMLLVPGFFIRTGSDYRNSRPYWQLLEVSSFCKQICITAHVVASPASFFLSLSFSLRLTLPLSLVLTIYVCAGETPHQSTCHHSHVYRLLTSLTATHSSSPEFYRTCRPPLTSSLLPGAQPVRVCVRQPASLSTVALFTF